MPTILVAFSAVCTPEVRRPLLCVSMGGQGARRKRNWRHNQPNSPYMRCNRAEVPPAVTSQPTKTNSSEEEILIQVRCTGQPTCQQSSEVSGCCLL